MLFHSIEFLFFFAAFYPVHLLLRRTRFANAWLLASSYVFYAWWSPPYLILIVLTTLVDFAAARRIRAGRHRRVWLAVSLSSNLGVLAYFKYAAFLTRNINALLSLFVDGPALPVLEPVLPLGISFFTFQSISYVVDVYRGTVEAEDSLLRYATYVSLFPQMISGPICRAGSLLPQLRTASSLAPRDVASGASLFLVGLFKKVALADYLALYVDRIYRAPEDYHASALAAATVAFAWQIYFDFSGYTDMARGLARAMGFHLTPNFASPYTARDLGDFWRRWNITVSTWFRDYVYIPLGGSRGDREKTARNVAVTMLASGLWHGASWTFVLWGAVHALGRVATLDGAPLARVSARTPRWIRRPACFAFVTFAWIFFRARSMEDAGLIIVRLFTTPWTDPGFPLFMGLPVAVVWMYQLASESGRPRIPDWACRPMRIGLAIVMLGYLIFVSQPASQTFIYFQF